MAKAKEEKIEEAKDAGQLAEEEQARVAKALDDAEAEREKAAKEAAES